MNRGKGECIDQECQTWRSSTWDKRQTGKLAYVYISSVVHGLIYKVLKSVLTAEPVQPAGTAYAKQSQTSITRQRYFIGALR